MAQVERRSVRSDVCAGAKELGLGRNSSDGLRDMSKRGSLPETLVFQ